MRESAKQNNVEPCGKSESERPSRSWVSLQFTSRSTIGPRFGEKNMSWNCDYFVPRNNIFTEPEKSLEQNDPKPLWLPRSTESGSVRTAANASVTQRHLLRNQQETPMLEIWSQTKNPNATLGKGGGSRKTPKSVGDPLTHKKVGGYSMKMAGWLGSAI